MGEHPQSILVVGAPGLDDINATTSTDHFELLAQYGLQPGPFAILLHHPVPEELSWVEEGLTATIAALRTNGLQILALKPNSDAGGGRVLQQLLTAAGRGDISLVSHLPRQNYLHLLRHAAILVGNSSSGIIEAASFGTPVVNIGSRQYLRQRNANILDVPTENAAIAVAIADTLARGPSVPGNVYGDGHAGRRICSALSTIDIPATVAKQNSY
jgi:GDP/UDP-N,N'-diacetylbacillosamine 2-epimerase (hydrolysing)